MKVIGSGTRTDSNTTAPSSLASNYVYLQAVYLSIYLSIYQSINPSMVLKYYFSQVFVGNLVGISVKFNQFSVDNGQDILLIKQIPRIRYTQS